jgi:glucose/arabinose dehydrogenase
MKNALALLFACCVVLNACGGGGGASAPPVVVGGPSQAGSSLTVPSGFTIQSIATVPGARELSFAPNGDLFVGTGGSSLYIVQNAEGQASLPHVFATLPESPAAGVAVSLQNSSIYVGTQFGVYRIAYATGDSTAKSAPVKIASVRTAGGIGHATTSVAVDGNTLYASVGSSCDACTETDPTRATIQQMGLDGSGMTARAVRIRNAIGLTVNPATNTLWAGVAGQDTLPVGHPYEFFDAVTLHTGVVDYGWPDCEENQHPYASGANCSNVAVPLVEFPAYETIIGATFYPTNPSGSYAFPAQYRGGAFVAMHGSWHSPNGCYMPPRVAFVSMNGDRPQTPVNWSDPTVQWSDFVSGFQPGCGANRIGKATGIAVGPQDDLFIADDLTGNIYRVRP